ncbi:hypothetical protein Ae201684_000526 [Aphanomyces euteiches]|uniref:Uncharacterized protein n=1 Tax=Aphanomyces euteiches TaxID=100861 RepID=A0A6G0XW41_9STRA|nr:hypothetical protein Ae201684_000526 [Aphanomyces euteiches]
MYTDRPKPLWELFSEFKEDQEAREDNHIQLHQERFVAADSEDSDKTHETKNNADTNVSDTEVAIDSDNVRLVDRVNVLADNFSSFVHGSARLGRGSSRRGFCLWQGH